MTIPGTIPYYPGTYMALLWAAGVALVLALCTAGARGDTYCAPPGVSNVTIASRTHVCVVFNGVARAYFTPEADKMTRLQFNGSTWWAMSGRAACAWARGPVRCSLWKHSHCGLSCSARGLWLAQSGAVPLPLHPVLCGWGPVPFLFPFLAPARTLRCTAADVPSPPCC